MKQYFRVGNLVTIIAGQWKGKSGVIFSILPDRHGNDDVVQVSLDSADTKVQIRPRDLEGISRSGHTPRPAYLL